MTGVLACKVQHLLFGIIEFLNMQLDEKMLPSTPPKTPPTHKKKKVVRLNKKPEMRDSNNTDLGFILFSIRESSDQ